MNSLYWTFNFYFFILQIVFPTHDAPNNFTCKPRPRNEEFISCGDIDMVFSSQSTVTVRCRNNVDISSLNFSYNIFQKSSAQRLESIITVGCKIGNLDNLPNILIQKVSPIDMDIGVKIPFDSFRSDLSKMDNLTKLPGWEEFTITNAANITIQSNDFKDSTSIRDFLIQNNEYVNLLEMQLPNLRRLSIFSNQHVLLSNDFFKGVPQLEFLDLLVNNLASVDNVTFNMLSNLRIMNLAINRLENLPNSLFRGLTKLEILVLGSNKLKTLNGTIFKGLSNLKRLDLSRNQLENLPDDLFRDLKALETLSLNENKLKTLCGTIFTDLSNLKELRLQNNQVGNLPDNLFSGLRNLEHLSLANNNLTTLDATIFKNVSNLVTLDLERNHLKHLPDNLFTELKALEFLTLSESELQTLSGTIFRNLSNLRYLYLNNNELTELPRDIFDNICLEKLYISRNRLNRNLSDYLPITKQECTSSLYIESYAQRKTENQSGNTI